MATAKETLHVALGVDSIAYAPLYIAHEAGFFGDLRVELGVVNPSKLSELSDDASTEHSLFEHVLQKRSNAPLLVACDPAHALRIRYTTSDESKVVGVLLDRPALWLFDALHKERFNEALIAARRTARAKRRASGSDSVHLELPFSRIYTHPKRWTADTLVRYVLARKGCSRIQLDSLIVNVSGEVGTEIEKYREALEDESESLPAVVTPDLLRLLSLRQGEEAGQQIVWDFSVDIKSIRSITRYPMTTLVAPATSYLHKRDEIERVLYGVSAAMQLAASAGNRKLCFQLLRRHYARRYTHWVDEPLPYLDPLPPLAIELENKVEDALGMLCDRKVFPPLATPGRSELHAKIKQAWRIYQEVNETNGSHLNPKANVLASFHPQRPVARKYGVGIMASLLLELTRSERPHPQTSKLVNAIKRFKGSLNVGEQRILEVPGCVFACHDPNQRLKLREFAGCIGERQRAVMVSPGAKPYCVDIVGDPGSGKSQFAYDVLTYLESKGWKTHKLSFLDKEVAATPDSFRDALVEGIKKLGASRKDRVCIFVDEVNKNPCGFFAYNHLLELMAQEQGRTLTLDNRQVDLAQVVWLFAGTHGNTRARAKANLQREPRPTGAPDWNSRVQGDRIQLPTTDAMEMLAKAASFLIQRSSKGREVKVTAEALFSLAVGFDAEEVRDLRDWIVGRIPSMRIEELVRLKDCLSDSKRSRFRTIYKERLADFDGETVTLRL